MIMATNKPDTMKRRLIILSIVAGFASLFAFNACKDDIDPIIEELTYSRAFTPLGFKATVSKVTTLTLTWVAAKDASAYAVEICIGTDFAQDKIVYTAEVTAPGLVYSLPAGDTEYSARVKTISSKEGVANSNWSVVSFTSGHENLFTDHKVTLTGLGSITVTWDAGKDVTSLLVINGSQQLTFPISEAEVTAGSKNIAGLTKGTNEIRIMNGTLVRGTQTYKLEGDAFLAANGDFAQAISDLPAGGVLLVESGAALGFAGPITLTKSIKIRGITTGSLPVIYASSTTSDVHMFFIDASLTANDSIVFQDIDISGYLGNTEGAKLRGVFDQQRITCNVGTVKFKGCVVHNFDRHAIRLRGDVAQVIDNVVFDGCIMYDYAFGSNYGVINSSANAATINNIIIKNSTIYYTRGAIITYTNGTACNGIIISDCTFNQLAQDASNARYIIDMNNTTSTGNINITNCIFGNTSTVCNGFRINTMVLNMVNCHYTSDFNDGVDFSAKTKMTAYSGASTDLWTDPLNGIFTFKGAFSGNAGDPRWKK